MRSSFLVLALGLCACASVPAASPIAIEHALPEPEPAALPRTEGIAGVVADRASSEPLPNAIVLLEGTSASRETTTNSAGRFFIPDVPAGTYSLHVLYGGVEETRLVEHDGDSRLLAEFAIDPASSELM